MKLGPYEKISLTDDELKRIDSICEEHHEMTPYVTSVITRYKERNEDQENKDN